MSGKGVCSRVSVGGAKDRLLFCFDLVLVCLAISVNNTERRKDIEKDEKKREQPASLGCFRL